MTFWQIQLRSIEKLKKMARSEDHKLILQRIETLERSTGGMSIDAHEGESLVDSD